MAISYVIGAEEALPALSDVEKDVAPMTVHKLYIIKDVAPMTGSNSVFQDVAPMTVHKILVIKDVSPVTRLFDRTTLDIMRVGV